MKKLNIEEIKRFARVLNFTESEAKDITDLFYNLKMENPVNHWRVLMSLNDVDEYIREWEDHWHRENNFRECFEYEKNANLANMNMKPQSRFSQVKKHLRNMLWEIKKHSLFISCPIMKWL